MLLRIVSIVLAIASAAPHAHALGVLTVGKQAVLRDDSGLVRVGRDPLLETALQHFCANGVAPHLTLSSYPQSSMRVATHLDVELPCARWTARKGGGWRYDGGAPGDGVTRIDLDARALVVKLGGDGYTAPAGPVGYVQVWLDVAGERLNARLHNFRRNEATLLVTRKPSTAAAAGEAAFWHVLHHDDGSEARQQAAMTTLGKAVRRDGKDGRSRFLLAMMHLYRFGQRVGNFGDVSAEAQAELAAAVDGFDTAVPLLWDGSTRTGDSRVPGFAAAAKYALGHIRGDAALEAQGLAELEAAVDVNPFFNVFDLIPVAQAVPANDPQFALVMSRVLPYLMDPETLGCVTAQPEICANAGLAPNGIAGALVLFGDLYAKAGDLGQATTWYAFADALTDSGYRFQSVLDDRKANAAARVAAYQDDDPANDPFVVGAREEACAVCHTK